MRKTNRSERIVNKCVGDDLIVSVKGNRVRIIRNQDEPVLIEAIAQRNTFPPWMVTITVGVRQVLTSLRRMLKAALLELVTARDRIERI